MRNIIPGVILTKHSRSVPWTITVLSLDLTNPTIRIESYRPKGLVKTTRQFTENRPKGYRVLAAINADFFSFKTGCPLSNQVTNGMFVLGVQSTRSHIGVNSRGKPIIDRLSFKGFLLAPKEHRVELRGVNVTRDSMATVLYTSFWGPTTWPDSVGWKVAVRLGSPQWVAGDTLRFIATRISSTGPVALDASTGVIAGPGLENRVRDGDTLLVFLGFEGLKSPLSQVLGGAGRILENGADVSAQNVGSENLREKFLAERHPRTFVGFNRDTTVLYLCTVDGRQAKSLGMNFKEMAGFLLSIGAWNGLNLDGGGSTTMVVLGKIENSPSDTTGERPVANSLQVSVRE